MSILWFTTGVPASSGFIDDNSITSFTDDNSVTAFIDDNGITG